MAGLSYVRAMSKLSTQNKWELNDVKDVNRRMFSGRSMQTVGKHAVCSPWGG
jgi:hypothetical protein